MKIGKALIFVASVLLVFIGHRYIGFMGLSIQLIGIAGILGLVWNYNRKFK